ncbi:capsid scaffolding protein, partial [Pseudomonas sp. PB105]
SVELGRLQDDSPNTAETGLIDALTGFFKRFAAGALPTETTPPQTESKPPMDEATATALTALVAQLLVVAAGLQAVIEPAAADAPEPDQDLIDDVSTAVDDIVATAEQEREFRRQSKGNQSVLAKLDALQKQFSALQNNSTGRQLPRNPGPVTTVKKRVL